MISLYHFNARTVTASGYLGGKTQNLEERTESGSWIKHAST